MNIPSTRNEIDFTSMHQFTPILAPDNYLYDSIKCGIEMGRLGIEPETTVSQVHVFKYSAMKA